MDKDRIIDEFSEIIAWVKESASNTDNELNNNSALDLTGKLVELVSQLQAYVLKKSLCVFRKYST